jgi:hypothetical protein
MSGNEKDVEMYSGDPQLLQANHEIPKFLKWTYIILPIWGVIAWFVFFNGTFGWFDPGHWSQLQWAANTKIPYFNADQHSDPEREKRT